MMTFLDHLYISDIMTAHFLSVQNACIRLQSYNISKYIYIFFGWVVIYWARYFGWLCLDRSVDYKSFLSRNEGYFLVSLMEHLSNQQRVEAHPLLSACGRSAPVHHVPTGPAQMPLPLRRRAHTYTRRARRTHACRAPRAMKRCHTVVSTDASFMIRQYQGYTSEFYRKSLWNCYDGYSGRRWSATTRRRRLCSLQHGLRAACHKYTLMGPRHPFSLTSLHRCITVDVLIRVGPRERVRTFHFDGCKNWWLARIHHRSLCWKAIYLRTSPQRLERKVDERMRRNTRVWIRVMLAACVGGSPRRWQGDQNAHVKYKLLWPFSFQTRGSVAAGDVFNMKRK